MDKDVDLLREGACAAGIDWVGEGIRREEKDEKRG